MSFKLDQLTEGITPRKVSDQRNRLVEKWSRTGLLRGLDGDNRGVMASLLENQAAALFEASTVGLGGGSTSSSGDLEGFTNIAFPIVRRVFGGLVANDLVSIQPMSLPAGLLFYLDYTYGTVQGGAGDAGSATYNTGSSIYGSPAGASIQTGADQVGGQYDLAGSGYSRVHVQMSAAPTLITSGAFAGGASMSLGANLFASGTDGKLLQFDPVVASLIEADAADGLLDATGQFTAVVVQANTITGPGSEPVDLTLVKEIGLFGVEGGTAIADYAAVDSLDGNALNILNVRRLNQLVRVGPPGATGASVQSLTPISTITDPTGDDDVGVLLIVSGNNVAATASTDLRLDFVQSATFTSADGATLVIPTFESDFAATPAPEIPEIDIKVESIPVVAETRKLRAKWSPELAQDLNAYHSLDAEVELTQILSEQIALEIDREILNDLLMGAAGANYYWSRVPGDFVDKTNGNTPTLATTAAFTGTVREWYETLIETIIDVGNTIHRKTLRGAANFIVVGPDVATILEASVYYRPALDFDAQGQVGTPFSIGAEKIGTLSNRFTVYKDPYFPRNKVLVGYKGNSYLETGYVYAPYVPLIVTPTIFAPEDFTPRKGVMTRYGKKMVRADFYGTVTVTNLNII
jgi:hypothetical protein